MNDKIIIFLKNNIYGILVLDYMPDKDIIGSYDSSNKKSYKIVEFDINEVNKKFTHTVNKNLERGWKIVYNGERNYG